MIHETETENEIRGNLILLWLPLLLFLGQLGMTERLLHMGEIKSALSDTTCVTQGQVCV